MIYLRSYLVSEDELRFYQVIYPINGAEAR